MKKVFQTPVYRKADQNWIWGNEKKPIELQSGGFDPGTPDYKSSILTIQLQCLLLSCYQLNDYFINPFNECYQCDHDLSMIIVLFWSLISGTAGDSFSYHDGQSFTTKDRDNDLGGGLNCGEVCKGGWWYKDCWYSNLNGYYRRGTYQFGKVCYDGVSWFGWKGSDYSLKRTEMKIRPVSF